jgi:gamma-glutamylcysteine synthetase
MHATDIAHGVRDAYPVVLKRRRVGLELEYPVVLADGRGVPFDVMRALFGELSDLGWRIVRDADTDCPSAAERQGPDGGDVVTVEFGAHTLEIVLAPTDDVVEAAHSLDRILAVLVPILRGQGAFLIGYGAQPVTPPRVENVAPRGRYSLLGKCWIDSPQNRYDVFLLTLSASSQTHVDVSADEVIPALNSLNLTSGLRIALFANSSVWNGQISGYAASRELFWDWCYAARKIQIGIPPAFSSIEDYVSYVLSFRSLLTRRGDRIYATDNRLTIGEFLANKSNTVETAEGASIQLTRTPDDLAIQWGLAWFDARLQPAYGTVEERCICQQPPWATMAPAALTLGLVENLTGLRKIADALPAETWRELRSLACRHGMAAEHPATDVPRLVTQLVEVARDGLVSRGCGEEKFLEPLYERIHLARHPSADVEQWFAADGASSIVRNSDMARFVGK